MNAPRRSFEEKGIGPLRRMPLVGLLAIIWTLVVDFATKVGGGGPSLSALLTVGTAMLFVALAPTVLHSRVSGRYGPWWSKDRPVAMPTALLLFAILAVLRLAGNVTMEGIQNVSVYVGFVLAIALTADAADRRDSKLWMTWLPLAATVVSVLFFLTFVVAGSTSFYGDRSYALSALVFLAMVVPLRGGGWRRWAPYLIVVCTVLSLSRTASLIALMTLVFTVVRSRRGRWVKAGGMLLAAAVGVILLWLFYAPFRERFTSGDAAVSVGGTSLNTSGRSQLWAAAWEHAMEAPLLGHGPGSATALITERFITITQPHNEYLRVLHDFGVVGLFLWVVGCLWLLITLARRAARFDRPVDWSALIALLAVLLASVTDNMIIYPFVMIPAGVVIGLGLAAVDNEIPLQDSGLLGGLPQDQSASSGFAAATQGTGTAHV